MWKDPPLRPEAATAREDAADSSSPCASETAMILALETSCDETAAALVTRDGEIRANVVASQAELHARFGGVVPEIASRRHLELVTPVVREALGEADATLDDVEAVAVTTGPGLIGALLVGLSAAKALAWARGLPLIPVDHLHGHVASLYLQPEPGRAAVSLPARERRAHAAARRARPPRLHRAGHDARRRRRRGLRQGRAAARPRLPGRRRDRPARAAGRSRGVLVPGRACARPRLLLLGAEDRAAVRGARPRRRRSSSAAGPTSRRATSARSSGRSSSAREPPPRSVRRPIAVVGGVAANSELRAALPDASFAPLALCTDNAAMIASAARFADAVAPPDYLSLDAYASAA